MPIIIFFYVCIFLLGFYSIKLLGGVKRNLPYSFYIIVSFLYYFVTPFYFYSIGRRTIWGDEGVCNGVGLNIADYYPVAFIYYSLALLCVILGYTFFSVKVKKVMPNDIQYNPQGKIILIFTLCFLIVFSDFYMAGINPIDVLLGRSESTMFVMVATTNYMRNFADSLVACIIISFYYNVKKHYLLIIILLGFTLFALLGFRYRIILSIFGILFAYFYKSSISLSSIFKYLLLVTTFLLFLLFMTVNRYSFIKGDLSKIIYNPADYDYSVIFEQSRGMLDDITIIKYYEVVQPDAPHDYGITFLYFIVRAIPRGIVGDEFKDSLYPSPAVDIILKSYNLPSRWGPTGEAPLHYAYFYIAGGVTGLLLLSLLTGIVLKFLRNRYPPYCDQYILINIFISIVLFQWISRGYFPQAVDHLAFILLGYYLFKVLASKNFKLS